MSGCELRGEKGGCGWGLRGERGGWGLRGERGWVGVGLEARVVGGWGHRSERVGG